MKKAHPTRPHLLAWRKKFDKTQQWLADEIGSTHTTIRRHELGALGVDEKTFAAIAKAYGISVAELSAHPDDAPRAQQMDRVLKAIQHMDEEGLAVIAGFAERIIKPK
jgi:transcriptional regulator with XRE-family HTH domain